MCLRSRFRCDAESHYHSPSAARGGRAAHTRSPCGRSAAAKISLHACIQDGPYLLVSIYMYLSIYNITGSGGAGTRSRPSRNMELPCAATQDIVCFDAQRLSGFPGCGPRRCTHEMAPVIDAMGAMSARAQRLASPITSADKLCAATQQRCYMLLDQRANTAVGFIKVGSKRLFVMEGEKMHEIEPLCVLDFYVHESEQRHGAGRHIFEYMLGAEQAVPHRLAYDRPSHKLLGFMRKHYGLANYSAQTNNFVVYKEYWGGGAACNRRPRQDSRPRTAENRQPGPITLAPSKQHPLRAAERRAADTGRADLSRDSLGQSTQQDSSRNSRRRSRGSTVEQVLAAPARSSAGIAHVESPPPRETTGARTERSAQLEEAAVLRLSKAAANSATSTEEDVIELRTMVQQALLEQLTTPENVCLMASECCPPTPMPACTCSA